MSQNSQNIINRHPHPHLDKFKVTSNLHRLIIHNCIRKLTLKKLAHNPLDKGLCKRCGILVFKGHLLASLKLTIISALGPKCQPGDKSMRFLVTKALQELDRLVI